MHSLSSYLSSHSITSVIFDLDETITTLDVDWDTFSEQFKIIVDDIDSTVWEDAKDQGLDDGILTTYLFILQKYGKSARDILNEWWITWETKLYRTQRPNKALTDFIKKNHTKYRMHLWTSNSKVLVNRVLLEIQLSGNFKKIICRDDVFFPKPDPEGFYLVYNPKHETKDTYLMIGDSIKDEMAAKKAGIRFLHVNEIKEE